jgi:hypothetical protein
MRNAFSLNISAEERFSCYVEGVKVMNSRHSSHGIIYFQGKVYVLGGKDQFGTETDHFEAYSADKNTWDNLPSLPCFIDRVSVAGNEKTSTLLFTGYYTRTIHTYETQTKRFGRLQWLIPKSSTKLL